MRVSSTTLKSLAIKYFVSEGWSGRFNIVVDAPNIDFLQYSVTGVTSQTFVIGPAFTHVTYDFQELYGDRSHYIRNATYLLRSIRNIELLCISDSSLMVDLLNIQTTY